MNLVFRMTASLLMATTGAVHLMYGQQDSFSATILAVDGDGQRLGAAVFGLEPLVPEYRPNPRCDGQECTGVREGLYRLVAVAKGFETVSRRVYISSSHNALFVEMAKSSFVDPQPGVGKAQGRVSVHVPREVQSEGSTVKLIGLYNDVVQAKRMELSGPTEFHDLYPGVYLLMIFNGSKMAGCKQFRHLDRAATRVELTPPFGQCR